MRLTSLHSSRCDFRSTYRSTGTVDNRVLCSLIQGLGRARIIASDITSERGADLLHCERLPGLVLSVHSSLALP